MVKSVSHHHYRASLGALLLGISLLFIPLLGNLHIESAVLASLIGCFWAGLRGCTYNESRTDFYAALSVLGYLYLVGTPLLVYALASGCFSVHGLVFWLLFPLPSVYFGYAIGRLLRKWNIPYRKPIAFCLLLLIAVGILLIEFFSYPQVYFFNHVWGGWPGPIYDKVVTINKGIVFFRSITMLWTLLLWHVPSVNKEAFSTWIVGLSLLALALSYTQLAEMGVVSPPSHIQSVLGGQKETSHFNLYYDDQYYSEANIERLAEEHEFYFRQISDKLELSLPGDDQKIASYLYANPWQKKRLVGAKFTSYVPVWLDQDQLHIAKQQIEGSLKHELVHVLSKQFGNRLLNASWSIGLIEGVAVAVAGGPSTTTTIDQIVASEKPYPSARELRSSISPVGFYGGRSGVNYTTGGSFVQYLLNNYPVEHLKEAYRTGRIAEAYPQGWSQLTQGWHQHLDSITVDSIDRQKARQIFSLPSLFEQPCPHVVSDFAATWDAYQYHQAVYDTTQSLRALDLALAESDSLPPVKAEWSYRHLVAGHGEKVRRIASLPDTTVDLQLLYADAFEESGDSLKARRYIQRAQALFKMPQDSLLRPALATRLNPRQWQIYRQLTYHQELPDSTTFKEAFYRTKIRSVEKAIEQEAWEIMIQYGRLLLQYDIQMQYFDQNIELIHYLGLLGQFKLAGQWIQKLNVLPRRDRHLQKLKQEKGWMVFLKNKRLNEKK